MRLVLEPELYPPMQGESWWIVSPNSGAYDFVIPEGAITLCTQQLLDFKSKLVYPVFVEKEGWVCVTNKESVVEMPQYLFARHFDAECFVQGRSIYSTRNINLEKFRYED
jgi:hypothetical protein